MLAAAGLLWACCWRGRRCRQCATPANPGAATHTTPQDDPGGRHRLDSEGNRNNFLEVSELSHEACPEGEALPSEAAARLVRVQARGRNHLPVIDTSFDETAAVIVCARAAAEMVWDFWRAGAAFVPGAAGWPPPRVVPSEGVLRCSFLKGRTLSRPLPRAGAEARSLPGRFHLPPADDPQAHPGRLRSA